MKISGTFLDEITHDIPSANWGEKEWAGDFDVMKAIGIDTVILIRGGYKDRTTFNSESLSKFQPMLPAYQDLVQLFLDQAQRCGMQLFFGLYDSGLYWQKGDYQKEAEINKFFSEEVVRKYGHHPAFKGWYLSHEMSVYDKELIRIYEELTGHLRHLKNQPILMSPYVQGRKQFEEPISTQEHYRQWDTILGNLSGKVDIVAFQDGQVDFYELPEMMTINKELADKHKLKAWSNVETFERGMPINFLPINWQNLRYKMEVANKSGVEKLITFEFSHFMSPNSIYRSAHNLYNRYREWLQEEKEKSG